MKKRLLSIVLVIVMIFAADVLHAAAVPLDIPECTCGSSGELVVSHSDDCTLKNYYVSFCNDTAENIFADWAFLPEDGREYILLFLSENDNEKYNKLLALLEELQNSRTVVFEAEDKSVSVYAADNAFPDGTTITTQELTVSEVQQNAVMNAVNGISADITVHGFCATDITFRTENGEEVQPNQPVSMKMKLNQSDSLSSANTVIVLHEGENGLEVVDEVPIDGENTQSVAVAASGFSSYYNVLVSVADNDRSLTRLYNNSSGSSGTAKATDFYAYITTPDGYCLTYQENSFVAEEGTYDKLVTSTKTVSQCVTDTNKNRYLWHFTVDTRDTCKEGYTVKDSYKITNVDNGKVIDLAYTTTTNGQPILVHTANDGSRYSNRNQRWYISSVAGTDKFTFATAADKTFVLDYSSANGTQDEPVILFSNSGNNHNFNIILDSDSKNTLTSLYQEEGKTALSGTVSALSDFNQRLGVTTATDFYAFISVGGYCLTEDETNTAMKWHSDQMGLDYDRVFVSTTTIDAAKSSGDKNKFLWHFVLDERDNDGSEAHSDVNIKNSYKIVNVATGRAIDLAQTPTGDTTSVGFPIIAHQNHDFYNQRWFINCVNDSGKKKFNISPACKPSWYMDYTTGNESTWLGKDAKYVHAWDSTAVYKYFDITLDTASKNTISSLYQEEGKTSLSGTVSALSDFYAYISFNDHLLTYKTFEGDSVSDRLIVSSKTADECKSNKEYYKKFLWHFTAETANELKWTDNSNQSITTKIGGSYKISNVGANEASGAIHPLDDQLHGTANNTPVTLCSDDNDNAAQRWFITYDTMYHKFAIHTSHNLNAVLDAQSGGTNDSIVDIYTNGDGYTANQRFDIILADTSEYQSSLMSDLLNNNSDYSVEGIGNVNLFNYDPIEFNNSETGSSLAFDGYHKYLSDFDEYNSDMYGSGTVKSYIDNNVNFYAYISFSTGDITRRIYYGEQTCYLGPDRITEANKDQYLWQFICQPDGSYAIKYKYNNKWLTINKNTTTETNASENFLLSDSLDDSTKNSYWKLEYLTDNGEEKFRFLPKTKGMEGFAMDVAHGSNAENNTLNAYKNGAVVNSYMSIEPQQMADPVNAGDHFYAYIAYRPENTSAWMSHKLYDTIDRFAVGDGANLDNEYLWEFVRTGDTTVYASEGSTTTVTGLENSYEIVSVADPTKCVDLNGGVGENKIIQLYDRNNTIAQRWYIRYCAEFDRFYLASAENQNYIIDLHIGDTTAGNATSLQKNTADTSSVLRSYRLFDLLLVNGNTVFGVTEQLAGEDGRLLSSFNAYTEKQRVTPANRFYANIGFAPDSKPSAWLTHNQITHNLYNTTTAVTYEGLVVGSIDNYTSDKNYLWEFIREESGTDENAYRIVNAAQPSLCLTVYNGNASQGAFVALNQQLSAEDEKRKSQLWYIVYRDYTVNGITYKRYNLVSAANQNLCMDVDNGYTTPDTTVNLWEVPSVADDNVSHRMFDLRIVNNISAYGLSSDVTSNIVNQKLGSDGYPVITGSNVTGDELFNPGTTHTGKTTVATDATMQFIYNKSTGYYEYKSTANHAQYNKATNTIEQYADTLGNYNYSSYDIPITSSNYLDTPSPESKLMNRLYDINLSNENGMLVGKMIGQDPHFAYMNLNIDADKVSRIYAKVYIDPRINPDNFSLYFKKGNETDVDFAETGRFKIDYDLQSGTDGWYEIVIDTSDRSNHSDTEAAIGWSGNITGLRIDPIDNPDNSA